MRALLFQQKFTLRLEYLIVRMGFFSDAHGSGWALRQYGWFQVWRRRSAVCTMIRTMVTPGNTDNSALHWLFLHEQRLVHVTQSKNICCLVSITVSWSVIFMLFYIPQGTTKVRNHFSNVVFPKYTLEPIEHAYVGLVLISRSPWGATLLIITLHTYSYCGGNSPDFYSAYILIVLPLFDVYIGGVGKYNSFPY